MNRGYKIQAFDSEGRANLTNVMKSVKNFMRSLTTNGLAYPTKIVIFTSQGEGPMLAYNQLSGLDVSIIAVTPPPSYSVKLNDGGTYTPEIPEKVVKFFKGVDIPVVRTRLPFDSITGADAHNKEMAVLKNVLAVFGGSIPLAIQAVLQATDADLIRSGEEVIAITADTALVVTASTTCDFLSKSCGLIVNEIICKPRNFTISRPKPKPAPEVLHMSSPSNEKVITLDGKSE
jgi:hypothetical protein